MQHTIATLEVRLLVKDIVDGACARVAERASEKSSERSEPSNRVREGGSLSRAGSKAQALANERPNDRSDDDDHARPLPLPPPPPL